MYSRKQKESCESVIQLSGRKDELEYLLTEIEQRIQNKTLLQLHPIFFFFFSQFIFHVFCLAQYQRMNLFYVLLADTKNKTKRIKYSRQDMDEKMKTLFFILLFLDNFLFYLKICFF